MNRRTRNLLAAVAVVPWLAAGSVNAGVTVTEASVTLTGPGERWLVLEGEAAPSYHYDADGNYGTSGTPEQQDPPLVVEKTYTWSVESATIVKGGGIHDKFVQISFAVGNEADAQVTVTYKAEATAGGSGSAEDTAVKNVVVPTWFPYDPIDVQGDTVFLSGQPIPVGAIYLAADTLYFSVPTVEDVDKRRGETVTYPITDITAPSCYVWSALCGGQPWGSFPDGNTGGNMGMPLPWISGTPGKGIKMYCTVKDDPIYTTVDPHELGTMDDPDAVIDPPFDTIAAQIHFVGDNGYGAWNSTIQIGYELNVLETTGHTTLTVTGQGITVTIHSADESGGCGYMIDWDGKDASGNPVPPGNYTVNLAWSTPGSASTPVATDSTSLTIVKVELQSIEFTSDHEDTNGDNLLKKSFLASDPTTEKYAIVGTAYEEPEWLPDGADADTDPDRNNPISHTKQSTLTVEVKLKVEPAGLAYDLIGDGPNDYLDFESLGRTSSGAVETITMTPGGGVPGPDQMLPNMVTRLQKSIAWTVRLTGPDPDMDISAGTSGPHEILVTHGTPDEDWSMKAFRGVNSITYKRLRLVCQDYGPAGICGGKVDLYDCAERSQNWLPEHGGITWLSSNHPTTASGIWGLIGNENGKNGQCSEFGQLHEMILRQIGISAVYRHLWATKVLAALEGHAKQIRYFSGATASDARGWLYKDAAGNYLKMDFCGQVDDGEGSIRLGNRVYTEAVLIIGVDNGTRMAEHHALMQLADHYADQATFQRYVVGNSATSWLAPAAYEPVPADPNTP